MDQLEDMAVPPTHLHTTFDTTTEEPSSIPVLDDPIPSDDSEDDIPSGCYRFRSLGPNSTESYDDINWPVDPVEPTLLEPSLAMQVPTNEHSSVHLPTNEHPPVPGEFIHSISLSPDGKHIVAGSQDGRVCMFDLHTGNIVGTPPWRTPPHRHQDIVLSVMYSPDGSRVVSGSQDTTIIQWDVTRGWLEPLARTPKIESVEGIYRGVDTVVYSPDGHKFASISGDSIVRIWDATSCTVLHALAPREEAGEIRLIGFTWALDGRRIFSYANETIYIWDAVTGDPLQSQVIGDTWAIQPSHSGDRVVTGGEDGTCRVWDVKTAADKPIAVTKVHAVHVWSVVFSPDDSYVASCSSDHQVIVSDSSSGAPLYSIDTENPAGGYPNWTDFEHLVFSPDGKYIITGDEAGCVDVWDLEGKRLAAKTKGHTAGLQTILPSADGRFLCTLGDGSVTVWNLEGITAGSSV